MAAPSTKEIVSRFNLVTGEDSFSGQNSQNPATSRRILSLIPSANGELNREGGEALYLPTVLPSPVGNLFQYDYITTAGAQTSKRFAATSTSLYMEVGGAWVVQTLPTDAGVTTTTPFSAYPKFILLNNLMHLSDGVSNWIYDGPNNNFVIDGFRIPLGNPVSVDGGAGAITSLIDTFYWYTFADRTPGRVHESSSSAISPSMGPITSRQRVVTITPGTISTVRGSTNVVGVGTDFVHIVVPPGQTALATFTDAFYHLYANGSDLGAIAFVTDDTHLTLITPAPSTLTNALILIAPARATHINVYKSESDGSKLGKFLTTLQVTTGSTVVDNSPFENQASSTILDIERPIRNDPPPASSILEVHKQRVFRRRDFSTTFGLFELPNRALFSAFEEVLSGNNGSPQESYPGADQNTLSDIINEFLFPKPAVQIRALKSHNDALWFATERDVVPMWGDTINEFSLSEVTAIDGGAISAWGMESLSHGLSIFTYDRKLYLYPPISPAYAITPEQLNVTDQIVEIGKPMRNKFLHILSSDQDNVRTLKYRYNMRDWLVVTYQDDTNVYHTFVYDFEIKGWYELQRGFVSLAVFEPTLGNKVLVGGGVDGKVYVVDDVLGLITPNATKPSALFRTSLIDFGNPLALHEVLTLEIEVSNPLLMDQTTTVNFYLDPPDADNPGTPIPLLMSPIPNFPNIYRGFFPTAGGGMGTLCRRLMVELNLASDTNGGSFREVIMTAKAHQRDLI